MTIVDRRPWGVSWTCEEPMERSSHALADEGRVWLIDPVADEAVLGAALELGEVAGVVQLLDRHPRDCAALARRFGVTHHRLPERLPGTPFELRRMVWLPGWRELSLWWARRRVLVVAESIGTGSYFAVGDRPAGIHPLLRALPPGAALGAHEPAHLLVGHGPALHEDAAAAVGDALHRSRRDAPRALAAMVRAFRPGR